MQGNTEMEAYLKEVTEQRQLERSLLTPCQRLAEDLHSLLCHSNHMDECMWEYEFWSRLFSANSQKSKYLAKAEALLELVDQDENRARQFINAIR